MVTSNSLKPNRVTVFQIHGHWIPPLLRLEIMNENLQAIIKTTAQSENGAMLHGHQFIAQEIVPLHPLAVNEPFDMTISISKSKLHIFSGGYQVDRDVSFWNHLSYFRAGAYPADAYAGEVTVLFEEIDIRS